MPGGPPENDRRALRRRLRNDRRALSPEERARRDELLRTALLQGLPPLEGRTVGLYFPIQAEPDLRPMLGPLRGAGARSALPVVTGESEPLLFREWRVGAELVPGAFGTSEPAPDAPTVHPDLLLVPLLGFDEQCYRLGYGGGFYDRTAAALDPRPLLVGVGYELARIPTIHPAAHDVAMDAICTERGFRWTGSGDG